MIHIKTPEEIQVMKESGRILAEVLQRVMDHVQVGVSELELDGLAEKLIREKGGEPGFMKVAGYHHTICASTNDVVVHGIPTEYKFKTDDLVGVDCGVFYEGFHSDMSDTVYLGQDEKVKKFLEVGKKALLAGIEKARIGNRVGHISKAIQDIVERENGYSVVRSLVGHGVGRELHEEPEVPGFLRGKIEATPVLKEGMVIAVEVIYNMGKKEVEYAKDGWTIRTADRSLAGLFERTVAITKSDPLVLTV